MKGFTLWIGAAIFLFLQPFSVADQNPGNGQDFVLIFSNNVQGDLEPCG